MVQLVGPVVRVTTFDRVLAAEKTRYAIFITETSVSLTTLVANWIKSLTALDLNNTGDFENFLYSNKAFPILRGIPHKTSKPKKPKHMMAVDFVRKTMGIVDPNNEYIVSIPFEFVTQCEEEMITKWLDSSLRRKKHISSTA